MIKKGVGLFLFLMLMAYANAAEIVSVNKSWPILKSVPAEITIVLSDSSLSGSTLIFLLDGDEKQWPVIHNKASGLHAFYDKGNTVLQSGSSEIIIEVNPIPLWLSIIPPLVAIFLALVFKEVYISLFFGIFSGAFIIHYYKQLHFWEGLERGILSTADTYFVEALRDSGHVSIIVFSMLIGGMVSIIHSNGGMKGLVNRLANYARSPRSGQLITWFLGIFIFFDDYANTLVVGNTMRPVTDRLKVSREKLAYIVDSTAAPIASIAFVTTWIGAELSYISTGLAEIGLEVSAYSVFLGSLKYAFYPVFTLVFVLFIILLQKDFGPMLTFERLSLKEKGPRHEEGDLIRATHWLNGVIPVFVVIAGTITGLLITGYDANIWSSDAGFMKRLSVIIGNADSYTALLWSSLIGVLVAISLTVLQGIMSVQKTMEALLDGFKSMLPAVIVLVMAWSLAQITSELKTATFISNVLINFKMAPWLIPTVTFIISVLVAFSTGSSWGTMAILYPLILPATWLICHNDGLDYEASMAIFSNVVSVVLAGSVMGDHCSPISDTTIMSSLASGCNHISHVKTQMPYALTVGFVAIFFGTIPSAIGWPVLPLFLTGFLILYLVIKFAGKNR